MSSPAAVGVEYAEGAIRYIVVNYDGYPDDMGVDLITHYTDAEKLEALLDLGELSSLGDTLETCDAYHRDHEEPLTSAHEVLGRAGYVTSAVEDGWALWTYLFTDSGWLIYSTHRGWQSLTLEETKRYN